MSGLPLTMVRRIGKSCRTRAGSKPRGRCRVRRVRRVLGERLGPRRSSCRPGRHAAANGFAALVLARRERHVERVVGDAGVEARLAEHRAVALLLQAQRELLAAAGGDPALRPGRGRSPA